MNMTRHNLRRVAAAPIMVLAVLLFILGHGVVGSAHPAGTATGGTILFERQNHWYTIAPNGTHLHMLVSRTAGCPDFGCAVFSPTGTRIMVAAHTADKKQITTAIINTDGSGYYALRLPDRALNLGPGAWSPGGARVALQGWDDAQMSRNGIYAVNSSNGADIVRLTTSPDGHSDDPLAYSPDGTRLLFFHEGTQGSSQGPGFGGLFETTSNGSGRIRLNPRGTSVTATFGSPGSWSPNGKQITFTAFSAPASDGQSAVFVANANGTHLRRITPWGLWSTSAHWSPNGTWILFDEVDPASGIGAHTLDLVHPNGKGLKAITSTARGPVCCAVWSPDGSKLLSFRGPQGGELVTMNRDGSGRVHLTVGDKKNETAEYAWGR